MVAISQEEDLLAIKAIVPLLLPLESGKFPGVFGARVLGHLTKSPANWHCGESQVGALALLDIYCLKLCRCSTTRFKAK